MNLVVLAMMFLIEAFKPFTNKTYMISLILKTWNKIKQNITHLEYTTSIQITKHWVFQKNKNLDIKLPGIVTWHMTIDNTDYKIKKAQKEQC